MMNTVYLPLLGGVLIGLASAIMMMWNGRIAGISGIVDGVISPLSSRQSGEFGWKSWFFVGMLVMGGVLFIVRPESFPTAMLCFFMVIVVVGLLVGFGTRLGSGCTSGHGVCGMSRLSPRSIVATLTFMAVGMLVVAGVRHMFGGVI